MIFVRQRLKILNSYIYRVNLSYNRHMSIEVSQLSTDFQSHDILHLQASYSILLKIQQSFITSFFFSKNRAVCSDLDPSAEPSRRNKTTVKAAYMSIMALRVVEIILAFDESFLSNCSISVNVEKLIALETMLVSHLSQMAVAQHFFNMHSLLFYKP